MPRNPIQPYQFVSRPFDLFDRRWLLLTSGDFSTGDYNCMTISWGSLGIMWGKPFAQVVVRPQRHTHSFMEKYPTFTLCAFPKEFRKTLDFLGTQSGREMDKIAAAGLTPLAASVVGAPCYAEAELVIECKKIYWADFDPAHFTDPAIDRNYPAGDYHRIYYGEILSITGTTSFSEQVFGGANNPID